MALGALLAATATAFYLFAWVKSVHSRPPNHAAESNQAVVVAAAGPQEYQRLCSPR